MTTATHGSLERAIVGAAVGPITQALDARWLMAYAAALAETDPRYYDTRAAGGPLAHPLFPVCYEWPAAVALRDETVPAALQPQSVHATHHLTIHRSPRAGDVLHTTARVIDVAPRRSGTLVVSRFDTVDARGEPVSTTDYGSIYRGVPLAGADAGTPGAPRAGSDSGAAGGATMWAEAVEIAANAALVYTECARIWNPIHTDVAVARRAGLSGPILHGTATLALAVSRVVARELRGEPARVREIRARFTGMVALPSTFTVHGRDAGGGRVAFEATGPDGASILSQGVVTT
jgi:acyl dehydratase